MSAATVDGRGLLAALRSVIPHASTDEEQPAINRVVIEVGSRITISATNRYTAALADTPVIDPDGEIWQAALLPGDAKEIVRLFKLAKDETSTLRIGVQDKRIVVTDVSGLFEGREFAVPNIDDEAMGPIIPGHLAAVLARPAGALGMPAFSAGMLALFDAAGREYQQPLIWTPTGETSPVIVQCGDQFLGLIMPVRVTDDLRRESDRILGDWADRLPVVEEAAA